VKATSDRNARAQPESAAAAPERDLLRFLTCGSVDDGKSTLIGRLLLDAALVYDDHLRALARDSKLHGTVGAELDAALLLDGLEAEREQAITIDVAYRHFATARRRFIVADTPGHSHYTRNMVTGASTSDLAVLLVDAEKGLLEQTRRHAYLCALLGIRDVVLAVNKMDLIGFREDKFREIADNFGKFASRLNFRQAVAIPAAARFGDNVVRRSERMPWHAGPALLEFLETVDVQGAAASSPLRLPVQWVNRPNAEFRGYAGTIASGTLATGDHVVVGRSGVRSRIGRIVTLDGDRDLAGAGDAVTVTLADDIDVSRGDVLADPQRPQQTADAFTAHVVWLSDQPLLPGRTYLLKCAGRTVGATVSELNHRIDVISLAEVPARELHLNEIGHASIATLEPITFDPYDANRETGSFILIDRLTNETLGAGMIRQTLHHAADVFRQAFDVTKASRAQLNDQKPVILWFTGLSGAGKSTIANFVERKLHALGKRTYLLDGDNVRRGLTRDLGFSEGDRVENIRRVAEAAKLFVDAGVITLVAFISPFRAERSMARGLVEDGEFIEIYVDASLEICERRDPKGLYRRARLGELPNFTGIGSPYEPPENPELRLDSSRHTAESLADRVLEYLRQRGVLR